MFILRRISSLALPLLAALATPLPAQAQTATQAPAATNVMAAVRADRWPEAAAAAAHYADPVAAKLVVYYRLLAPHAAGAQDIAAFMRTSPDWPAQSLLARRYDEALAAETDDAAAAALCQARMPSQAAALERCAVADAATGAPAEAEAPARAAWIAGNGGAAWESAFLARWGSVLRPADQMERFDNLAWTDMAAAIRQATRLGGADRQVAEARLALRRDAPEAAALLAAAPPERKADPLLFYEHVRWLRRAGQDDAALALWKAVGATAERAAPEDRRAAFWAERDLLARRLLRDGNDSGAYAVVDGHAQTDGVARLDAEFLAGFIALRRLHDPAEAARHFRALMVGSHSAITLGRGHYWLARALAAQDDGAAAAKAEYARAAAWPNTFYGQLAVLALGEGPQGLQARIEARHDPDASPERALDFAGRELARAAALLTGWGEPHRAQAFLLRLSEVAPDAVDRVLAARLGTGLGLPQMAVFIARRAGSQGQILLNAGWPTPFAVPTDEGVDPALVLGLIRQESSFAIGVVSPSGARGLMQLMPPTATMVARQMGARQSIPALTVDADYNMRLGIHYLRAMLDRFGGCTPLAVAAYNAGPNRVQQWLVDNGNPCEGGNVDMIDWLELIPFSETRNYVQRVTENTMIYAAQRAQGKAPAYLLARWIR